MESGVSRFLMGKRKIFHAFMQNWRDGGGIFPQIALENARQVW